MTKLNQIVALVQGEKQRANKTTAPLFHTAKAPALFAGLTQTYQPVDEDGVKYPDDNTQVQFTVDQILSKFARANSRMLDLISTNEEANRDATANVKVNGAVLITDAPVTFLMQFQKFLEQEVRGIVKDLPVQDPSETWTPSGSAGAGVFESREFQTHKTSKVQKALVLAQATDKFPAQTQLITEDELVGYWTKKKFSGAVSQQRKDELTERVETLIAAVKSAREAANDREVIDKPVGDAVFDFLFSV